MKKDVLGVMLVMTMVCCTILSGCGKKAATENTVKNRSTQNEIETEYNNTTETESVNTENTNTNYEIPTEYDMEEYADGYIIVSKTDHLLYGVIDIEGREVIPVEYDNIDFVRRNGEVDIEQGIYFCASMKGKNKYLTVTEKKYWMEI